MKTQLRKVESWSAAALAKLASSGIEPAQANSLGMYGVANAASLYSTFEPKEGLVIPYFGTDGKPLAAHPTWPQFYRVRYLDGPVKGFEDLTEGKAQRYTQPPETGVCAYFPLCTDWASIVQDPSQPVLITEGELKAAKASLEGYPTIGLGGVYNYRQMRRGVVFLPELAAFNWVRRKVTICYDSDYKEKPGVCAAINDIAEELTAQGAIVFMGEIPNVYEDDRKSGLDDLLIERGDSGLDAVLDSRIHIGFASALWELNSEIAYIQDPGFIVIPERNLRLPATVFTGHSEYATMAVPERKVLNDGTVSYERGSVASVWLKWPMRRSASRASYIPGQERFLNGGENGVVLYNQWRGWGCEAKKGDIKPWQDLLAFLFEGSDKGFLDWFLDWCAYPLQYPGTKLYSAVIIHGRATGTGKTLIGYTLGDIYGENFTKVEGKDLKREFNEWAENRQFVLGDEISSGDKRSESDAMKTVITQQEIRINVKQIPAYTIPDCINYYFTSNHADAFFIEDEDRRYGIHRVKHRAPLPIEFYQAYDEWRRNGGAAALFDWLLKRDVSGFNPKGPAFKTSSRAEMVRIGRGDLAAWCAELAEHPDEHLYLGQLPYAKDLFTASELLRIYQQNHDEGRKVTPGGMGKAMAVAGFEHVYNSVPIPLDGSQGRYYAVRNRDKWATITRLKDFVAHLRVPLRERPR